MRVLHVMPSMAPSYGGPAAAMPVMARGLIAAGACVDVAAISNGTSNGMVDDPGGFRRIDLARTCGPYGLSFPLARWLAVHVREYDLVHVHGAFTHSSTAACRASVRAGVPFIVRPLGILNSWGMENRRPLLKKLFFRFIEKPWIDQAAAMHFTSAQEADDVARLGIRARSVIIPLGLDLADFEVLPSPSLFLRHFPEAVVGPRVLFVSRLDRKKGLDLLLPAFREVVREIPSARLIIAGSGPPDLLDTLRRLADEYGLANAITWAGFIEGELKLSALAAADVFCLPSYSENFGMALLEAMAAGLPCIASDQVALAVDAAAQQAVEIIPCRQEAITQTLLSLLCSGEDRARLGSKARNFAQSHHGMPAVGARLMDLYRSILLQKKIGKTM